MTDSSTPIRRSREQIQLAIRDAAIAEFSSHGFRGASTQAIAERAGLTKPQLHYYIESKQALYDELLYALLEGWSAAFAFDPALDDPRQIIGNYVRRKLDYALDNPALSCIFTNEILGGGSRLGKYWPMALASTEQKAELMQVWMAQGRMRKMDPRVLLMQIWGMTQHYADYAVQARVMLGVQDDAPLDREHIARELTTSVLLCCGLAPI